MPTPRTSAEPQSEKLLNLDDREAKLHSGPDELPACDQRLLELPVRTLISPPVEMTGPRITYGCVGELPRELGDSKEALALFQQAITSHNTL